MTLLFALLFGYLCGSVPFGILAARVFGLGNLRAIGSGNIGATNVLRTGNRMAAFLTLLLDALKGTVAVLVAARWGEDAAALAALGAFVGHCYPVWLRFMGGKGVATFLGALIALHWPTFVIFAASWLTVAIITRYSSLAALLASGAALSFYSIFARPGLVALTAVILLVLLLVYRHRENIVRLMDGKESKVSFGKPARK